ncbi:glycosyltransferase family 2 protein [Candidatus Pacearchaeota archaeon]|nr:glycosyltransferase family 2 protein [Candidatus Pacearchaeota archaeon]
MELSIIMPVYNEERTLEKIVSRVQKAKISKVKKEIVIVNDASKDNTEKVIKQLKKRYKNIKSFSHAKNKGKGAAIQTALKHISGGIIVIQDGDTEYNPEDFKRLIQPILDNQVKVVYGSRMLGNRTGFVFYSYYFGNKFLTLLTRILYQQKITDMETCYKMMSREVIDKIQPLESNRFDIEPEITAKIIKNGYKILEIPINYNCRSFEQGKKIRWQDGIIAIYKLFKYRFFN